MYGKIDARTLRIDPRERCARLGVATDSECRGEAECLEALLSAADIAFCATRVAVSIADGGASLGEIYVQSDALARVLSGCSYAYLLVATLGFGVDRINMCRGSAYSEFLADALADCLIEAAANEACLRLGCKEILTNRFSPGYSDLDLEVGKDIVSTTGADKLLGVRFTESGLMVPKKTVSAVVGIKGEKK